MFVVFEVIIEILYHVIQKNHSSDDKFSRETEFKNRLERNGPFRPCE